MEFRYCVVIPVYNHCAAIGRTVRELGRFGLPCIAVNDGSSDGSGEELDRLQSELPWCQVVHREKNGGKGAAMLDGLRRAADQGFTHAVSIDADGQHDLGRLHEVLDESRRSPHALLVGRPLFDDNAPLERRVFRELSNAIVWVATLARGPRDVLCGFRVYPLASCAPVLFRELRGRGMDFDPEALVRLVWAGVPVLNTPVTVRYPSDGVSHFRYVRDNLLLALLYVRLICEMPVRWPGVLRSRRYGHP